MADLPIYETALNILREAGFVLSVKDEVCDHSGNVVTTAFANYISSTADDAIATAESISASVDGVGAAIAKIDAIKGQITLSGAPSEGAQVKVSYCYSPVPLDFVSVVRNDVECSIVSKMRSVDRCVPYADKVPYAVRLITRLWSAGLLLGKEYGYNADTENSVSDGYRRIKEAKSLLEDFYNAGGACGASASSQIDNTGGSGDVMATGGNLFREPRGERPLGCSDRFFEEF